MRRRSSVRTLLIAALFASIVPVANSIPPLSTSSAADGSVSGTVFDDKDMSGTMNGSEAGVQGILVKAYDSAGTLVGSATTAANGTYTLAVTSAATTSLRIEFTTPDGYEPSFVGSGNATSIQFVLIGATNVNYGIQIPAAYCDNNNVMMSLAAACIRPGTSSGTAASTSSVASIGWTSRTTATMTTFGNTGAIWGLGSDRSRGTLWASAVVRRHAGLGSKGLGGLYVLRQSSAAGVVASFDLAGAPYNLSFAASPSSFTDASRGISNSSLLSLDTAGYAGVGKAGIGDIDVSSDNQFLYVTNLYTRTVHRFELGGTSTTPTLGAMTTYNLPTGASDVCPGTTTRPWALNAGSIAGRVLVGVVCSGEEAAFSATSNAAGGVILELNPSTNGWTTKATVNFTYGRGFERCTAASLPLTSRFCEPVQWHNWTDDFAAIRAARTANDLESVTEGGEDLFWYSQPMIVDIEQLTDGSLVLGVSDRFNYQLGSANIAPDETNVSSPTFNYLTSRVAGDVLLLCKTASGFSQESDGSCVGTTTTYTAAPRSSGTAGLASATPYQEFFDDNVGGTFAGAHQEITIGGLAIYPSSGTQLIAMSAMDADNNLNSNGVRWFNLNDGSMNGSGAKLTEGDVNSFEKSVSMGDLELICDAAPVQIGNRIWYDMNRNGIQDAGEAPVPGVVVELYTLTGTKLGTAVTDANGTYYFSSTVSEVPNGNGDNRGGGLSSNTQYQIRVGSIANYTGGASSPLSYEKWEWTARDATDPSSSLDDSIDSDGTLVNQGGLYNQARLTTPSLSSGQVNHTFDFGVAPKPASVGSRVWFDTPNDWGDVGTQNDIDGSNGASEVPAVGVTLRLTDLNGNSVTDINGNVVAPQQTDSNGNYLFNNLWPGQAYKVTIDYPTGYGPAPLADSGIFDRTPDTSSWSEVTGVLNPGEADLTLDFGLVPAVEVGNFVWIDTDQDGVQDAGEAGLAGVTVTLTDSRGNPVSDTSGLPVGPTTTDSNGRYVFKGLPSGTYNTRITYPAGYGPTRVDQGSDRAADSSGRVAVSAPLVAGSPSTNSDMRLDFGVVPMQTQPVAVGDLVWIDTDADGIQDANEAGIAGVTLTITDANDNPVVDIWGAPVGAVVTGATGQYLFEGLPPGQYKVWITYPTGYGPTTAGVGSNRAVDSSTSVSTSLNLTAGQADLTLDFGIRAGVPAPPPTSTTTTTSSTTTSSTTTSTTPATSSTSTSSTSSTVAPATSSTSTTVASSTAGTTTTTTSSSTTTSTTAVTTTTSSIPPATVADGGVSVGNYVWIDLNKDGIQDAGEPGIAGVKLTLRDSMGRAVTDRAGKPVEPTYTDASGYYYFSNLPVGRYEVFITYPKGYLPTKTGSGTTANDSSTDSALSKDLPTPGMKDHTLDFGVIPSAVIEEPIWVDTNGDGFLSSGERLVPGADVIILNEDGSPAKNLRGEFVTPVRSQADGSFAFKDLAPGKYKVVVVYPEGYTAGPSNASSVMFTTDAVIPPSAAAMSSGKVAATPKPSAARTVTPVVSIGNLVWFDLDKDGFQDPAERGVSGATLTAFKADGKTRARDVNGRLVGKLKTSKTGRFLFTNLPPGGYVVKIVYPAGYRATIAKSAGRAKNSSTNVSKSLVLAAGESDMTLDFGLVRMPVTRLPSTL